MHFLSIGRLLLIFSLLPSFCLCLYNLFLNPRCFFMVFFKPIQVPFNSCARFNIIRNKGQPTLFYHIKRRGSALQFHVVLEVVQGKWILRCFTNREDNRHAHCVDCASDDSGKQTREVKAHGTVVAE
ncbi:hypothetical protein BC835DRAFT_1368874 [Cytidiella melzeri]|nr:hypothetical protein BC835DRAFT_1368874 [Cytidiella melzeri]